MAKRIALKDRIMVDGVDLSNFARSIDFTSTTERVDASGFNPTGASEFLLGSNVREVTVEFIMGRGSSEPHQILWNLHQTNAEFDFKWLADGSGTPTVSSTNPELRGTVQLAEYGEGATRGELETRSVTFIASDATDPLTFYAT